MRRPCCRTLNRVQPLWMLRLSLVHMMSGGGSPSTGQGSFMVRPRRTLCRWATRSDTLGGPSCREREREEEESCYSEILQNSVIFSECFSLDTFRNRSENNQPTDETSHKLFSFQQQQIHFFFLTELEWNQRKAVAGVQTIQIFALIGHSDPVWQRNNVFLLRTVSHRSITNRNPQMTNI